MGARDKLNAVVVWYCLIISGMLGSAMGSWGAFWGILVIAIGCCYCAGGIRTHPDIRPPAKRPGGEARRRPGGGRRA